MLAMSMEFLLQMKSELDRRAHVVPANKISLPSVILSLSSLKSPLVGDLELLGLLKYADFKRPCMLQRSCCHAMYLMDLVRLWVTR